MVVKIWIYMGVVWFVIYKICDRLCKICWFFVLWLNIKLIKIIFIYVNLYFFNYNNYFDIFIYKLRY